VFPKTGGEPAFEVAFTQVSFVEPGEEQFTFKPPAGVKVTEEEISPEKQGKPEEQRGAPAGTNVVGNGWTSVLVARTSAPDAEDTASGLDSYLASLPRVSGSWGSGNLLKGKLFTALLTDDGRLIAGAVTPERLYAVAAQK
jgi:hypothetical protein